MKKLIVFLVLLLSVSTIAYAKSGDIAGHYYSTDIKTYLNGAEIDSINIGGQTLISAEDMYYYSFGVYWDEGERTLMIDETANAANGAPPLVVKSQLSPGTPVGYYYETDIVTYLDNEPITAYNIGGRTYIHAEEMRNFGYTVNWDEKKRTLDIISPIRAGYVYDIGLSYGKKKTEEGAGSFSVKYTNDGLWGTDDADYLDLSMRSNGKDYTFSVVFYQNDGLFYSSALQDLLRPLSYDGYGVETPCEKSEKYDLVNETISISINGQKAEKVSVISGAGNGHRDFYFTVEDLPALKKDEINEIVFAVGNPSENQYVIEIPDYVINGPDVIAEKLKKYANDFLITYYLTDDYYVFFMKESQSLGVVKDRLYIVNKDTLDVSDDILEQVRQYEGFNYDIVNPFAFGIGDIKNNFFFSCSTPEKSMDFYAELDTGKVHIK